MLRLHCAIPPQPPRDLPVVVVTRDANTRGHARDNVSGGGNQSFCLKSPEDRGDFSSRPHAVMSPRADETL